MIKMRFFEKIADGNITNNVQWEIKKIIKYISCYIPVLIQYFLYENRSPKNWWSFSEISTQIFLYNKKEKKKHEDFITRTLIEEIYKYIYKRFIFLY